MPFIRFKSDNNFFKALNRKSMFPFTIRHLALEKVKMERNRLLTHQKSLNNHILCFFFAKSKCHEFNKFISCNFSNSSLMYK